MFATVRTMITSLFKVQGTRFTLKGYIFNLLDSVIMYLSGLVTASLAFMRFRVSSNKKRNIIVFYIINMSSINDYVLK